MDWYPLWNSLRIAVISTVVIFFAGIFAAYYIAKLPRLVKGVLDVLLTLPLVLPPTVVGYLLLRVFGPKRVIGAWVLETFGVKMVMTWWSAIFATVVVIFPLMYRTVRGAFESFDETLAYSGQTLGLSNTCIFWRIRMPYCRQGVLAGTVLAFARALGEYGATSMIAGYTPGKTATISTTVYQLWQTNNDALAMKWVIVNMAISAVVLLAYLEESDDIDGVLFLLNTVGGDVEAGLAIAELISGMKKPTVSLVLGGGHSIGVPLAVAPMVTMIAPSASMTIHPVRTSGTIIAAPQTYQYFERLQERIVRFVTKNSRIGRDEFLRLMMDTQDLASDVGSVLYGEEAVACGLIQRLGSLSDALDALYRLIDEKKK